MQRHNILILEDSPERRNAFELAIATIAVLELQPIFWDSAPKMIDDLSSYLGDTAVISLDYDLVPHSKSETPGNGLDVCRHLETIDPVCPILLHTSNETAVWPMLTSLGRNNWPTQWVRHEPVGELWIGRKWLPSVLEHLNNFPS